MVQKPEIQYVDQFYVFGSEAPAKKKKLFKPAEPKKTAVRYHKIYIDLGALLGLLAAAVLTAALVMGAINLSNQWQEHDLMEDYVSYLKLNNSTLQHNYRISYDLEQVEKMALDLGLVPESEVETRYIRVQMPEPQKPWTIWENIRWFFEGLF